MDETTLTRALRDLAAGVALHTAPAADARARARRLQVQHRLSAAAAVVVVAAGAFGVRDLAGRSAQAPAAANHHVLTIQQVHYEAPCDPSLPVPAGEVKDRSGKFCYKLAAEAFPIHPKAVESLYDSSQGYFVQVDLNDAERVTFGALTARVTTLAEPLNQLAIVLDGVVLTAPSIQSAIDGGTFQITGGDTAFTKADVDALTAELTE